VLHDSGGNVRRGQSVCVRLVEREDFHPQFLIVLSTAQYNALVQKYYADLTVSWNDIDNLVNIYPNYFTTTGQFCTATGTPCLTAPMGITLGLRSFTTNITTVSSRLGDLRICSNVGSYAYEKVFVWKNGCPLIINGFSAFTVDTNAQLLMMVNDYVDLATFEAGYQTCLNWGHKTIKSY